MLCALTVHASLPPRTAGETIDRVLAVVAGQLIMLSDVTAARDLGFEVAEGAADPVRAVLAKLIDRQLMLVEVDRYAPPQPSADAVDRELAAVRARFGSDETFASALARSGIDVTHVRERLREDLRIRAYLDQRFGRDERRESLIEEWIGGLRRRGSVTDLYQPAPGP
jgi:hypothetical protein